MTTSAINTRNWFSDTKTELRMRQEGLTWEIPNYPKIRSPHTWELLGLAPQEPTPPDPRPATHPSQVHICCAFVEDLGKASFLRKSVDSPKCQLDLPSEPPLKCSRNFRFPTEREQSP